uniref:Uncharacterized protein n=1 Tax=viral metagenome TaxID=1070528 RepID=A0A6C0HB15_9ZZZZ
MSIKDLHVYDWKFKKYKEMIIRDGYYFPFLQVFIYLVVKDFYLSTIIIQKLYVVNYYYHYEHLYDHVTHPYNWVKQFVRFTDTGRLASFMYYIYPQTLPIAHNVHFIITFAYWFARIFFGMDDRDQKNRDSYLSAYEKCWTVSNHGLVYCIIVYRILTEPQCNDDFTVTDFYYTVLWLYSWGIFIYIPWRCFTGDPVYSILANDKPLNTAFMAFVLMNSCAFISNYVGYLLTKC